MTIALELVRFRVAEEDVERLLALRPAAIEAVRTACPGMIRADMFRSQEDGLWYDLVLWETVEQAVDGDRAALEHVCRELQDPLYRLALRMFTRPEDAADATQEALVRIVTHLGKFEGRSKRGSPARTGCCCACRGSCGWPTCWAMSSGSRTPRELRPSRLRPPPSDNGWPGRDRPCVA